MKPPTTLTALASAALTAVVLAATGGATAADPPVTYWRAWGIHGTHPYFQVWNPGPGPLCVETLTVASNSLTGVMLLFMHHPLPTDISTWDKQAGKDQGNNASNPEGTHLATMQGSQGQLRASVGQVQYGAQIWNSRINANRPYTIHVNDCVKAGKGIGVRFLMPGVDWQAVAVSARWSE